MWNKLINTLVTANIRFLNTEQIKLLVKIL